MSARNANLDGALTDVAHEAGAGGEPSHAGAGQFEPLHEELGRGVFFAAQFGVGVEVPTRCDQAFTVLVQPGVDRAARHDRTSIGFGGPAVRCTHEIVPRATSSRLRGVTPSPARG